MVACRAHCGYFSPPPPPPPRDAHFPQKFSPKSRVAFSIAKISKGVQFRWSEVAQGSQSSPLQHQIMVGKSIYFTIIKQIGKIIPSKCEKVLDQKFVSFDMMIPITKYFCFVWLSLSPSWFRIQRTPQLGFHIKGL